MFYGWRIVAVGFVGHAVSTGATFHIFGVFMKTLAAEFDTSRLLTVLGPTALALVGAAVSPLVGRWLDRGRARSVMLWGALLLGAGFGAMALSRSIFQLGAFFALGLGLGHALLGNLSVSTVVANWFVADRGRALGVASIGSSVGGFVLPPLSVFLIAALGWRGAYAVIGAGIVLLIGPMIAAWIVDRPEQIGLQPDGARGGVSRDGSMSGGAAAVESETWTSAALLRSRNFWVITASVGLVFSATGLFVIHLVPYATDQGIPIAQAALVPSAYAASAGFGKYLFGRVADRIPVRNAFLGALALQAGAWSLMLLHPGFSGLLGIGILMGLSAGGRMPVFGALVGRAFGRFAFGRAMGWMAPLMLPLSFIGPPLGAWVHDRTGSYDLAFQIFLGVFVLAALMIGLLRLPQVPEPGGVAAAAAGSRESVPAEPSRGEQRA